MLTVLPLSAGAVADLLDVMVVTEKSDIQFILAFIIGGVFTLTVFSYTMVMNVLNRSINNYSPRLMPLILSERHHQLILGFTSGTIIYAMILSLAAAGDGVREFPPLGAAVGVLLSICCVFLFIYFIHSVTQVLHINYILKKSFDRSKSNLEKLKSLSKMMRTVKIPSDLESWNTYKNEECGYLQLPNYENLIKMAQQEGCHISIQHLPGMFIYEDEELIKTNKNLEDIQDKLKNQILVDRSVPLQIHEIEIKHLVEVAVKAASPAINDPGTARGAIDYLTQILILRNKIPDHNSYTSDDVNYVFVQWLPTLELAEMYYEELWNYMNQDPILLKVLQQSVKQLHRAGVSIRVQQINTDISFA